MGVSSDASIPFLHRSPGKHAHRISDGFQPGRSWTVYPENSRLPASQAKMLFGFTYDLVGVFVDIPQPMRFI